MRSRKAAYINNKAKGHTWPILLLCKQFSFQYGDKYSGMPALDYLVSFKDLIFPWPRSFHSLEIGCVLSHTISINVSNTFLISYLFLQG